MPLPTVRLPRRLMGSWARRHAPVAAIAATGIAVLGVGAYAASAQPLGPAGAARHPAGQVAGGAASTAARAIDAATGPGASAPTLAPLPHRLDPDVMVRSHHPLSVEELAELRALAVDGGATVLRAGKVVVGTSTVHALGVDAGQFREFTPAGTADATGVWQAVADGEAVVAHDTAKRLGLPLGGDVRIGPAGGGAGLPLRLGALATTTLPGSDVLVDLADADRLGLAPRTGMLLSSAKADPSTLAERVRRIVGDDARIDLLGQPAANPVAFLTGSRAARAFGAFSYRYFPDGTIEPDAAWVRHNIRTESVPILGSITCNRLMFPQLRAALAEVVADGLASTIKPSEYGGCYVPRFIESNPDRSISLHTWGIAIDLNVPENLRGTAGQMDRRVVAIFAKWGLRWGGTWSYTDPMHFELGALLKQ